MATALLSALGRFAPTLGKLASGPAAKGLKDVAAFGFDIQQVKQLAENVGDLGKKAINSINPLHQFSTGISFATGAFTKSLGLLTEPLDVVTGGFRKVHDAISALGGATADFVKYSDPNAVHLFELAFKDASAAIGHAIGPIMELGIALERGFGDIVAKLAPAVSGALNTALRPLIDNLPRFVDATAPLIRLLGQGADVIGRFTAKITEAFNPQTLETLTGAFQVLEEVMQPFITALDLIAQVMAKAIAQTVKWAVELADLLGIRTTADTRVAGGSVGLGATNAKTGSIESFTSEAWVKALQQGRELGPAEKTASAAEQILEHLREKLVPEIWEKIKGLAEEIAKLLPGYETAKSAREGDVVGTIQHGLGIPDAVTDAIGEAGRRADNAQREAREWADRNLVFWK